MKRYPDPREHFNNHIQQSAQRYATGLRQAGLSPNDRLTHALAERAVNEAQTSYERETDEVLQHNIGVILNNHEQEMNEIKRNGHKLRLWTCPPVAAVFGAVSWYTFVHVGDVVMGIAYAVFALAFLAMLIFGAIFDRPTTKRGGRRNG